MGPWGSYELSRKLSVSMRDREILIDRTCARCRCEYEWGVHIAFFAENELLDIYMLCGWYHAISYTANAAGVDLEEGAPTFAEHEPA